MLIIEDFKASVQDIMQYSATAETMVWNATLKPVSNGKDKYLALRDELLDVHYDTYNTDIDMSWKLLKRATSISTLSSTSYTS